MSTIRIIQPVRLDGFNSLTDVEAVQTVLNKSQRLISLTQALIMDGRLNPRPESSKTIAAIKLFQSKVLNMVRPDGEIDPNGRTHRKMNEKLTGEAEIPGIKANPQIVEYFKASKFWGSDDSGGQNAWCGSFVAWVMQQNKMEPVKNAFRAKEWASFGKPLDKPVFGAIGIKSRKGGGHVAFVVGQSADGNYLYMLGGNQSNSVNVAKYKKELWDDFVVPANFDPSSASLPIYTQKASVAGSEA